MGHCSGVPGINWHSSYGFATLAFLFLMRRVQDHSQWNVLPTQLLFLLVSWGSSALAFAFLIRLNQQTAPLCYFLFGVLFAVCFSCLLTHASNLVKLVWGQVSSSWTTILCISIGVSPLQTIIATEYVTLIVTRGTMFMDMTPCQLNVDFAVLLVYVLFLLALTFFVSKATFCGPCEDWKRRRRLIFLTALISIIIWVVWVSMLMRGNPTGRPCPLHRPGHQCVGLPAAVLHTRAVLSLEIASAGLPSARQCLPTPSLGTQLQSGESATLKRYFPGELGEALP